MEYYISLSIISIIISSVLFFQVSINFKRKEYSYFRLMMLAVVIWNVTTLMELFSYNPAVKVFYSQLSYLGIAPLAILWYLFSLEYANKINLLEKRQIQILWFIPILTLLLVFTNRFHHLHWSSVNEYIYIKGYMFIIYKRGIWFYILSAYSYILLFCGMFQMIKNLFIKKKFFSIIPGVLMPVISNILYLTRTVPMDYTPVAFSITCICFAWVIISGFFQRQISIKDRLLSASAYAIGILLEDSNYIHAVNEGLKVLIQAAQVKRAYLFKREYDENPDMENKPEGFKYVSGASESAENIKFDIPTEHFKEVIDPLQQGRVINSITADLKNENIRHAFRRKGILAVLLIPVFVGDKFWGFIGFDECNHERTWSEAESSVLITFAHSVARAIGRGMIENELRIERVRAEAAYTAKSQFLANMSHEIRTPMNGIIGFLELLSQTNLNHEQDAYLREINIAADALLELLDNILDYSKIDANKVELENIAFNVRTLAEDAARLNAPRAHSKGLEIFSLIYSNVPNFIKGDPVRLRQVINNLIGNAVKFTNKGEIEISVECLHYEDSSVHLKFIVSDTGIGISKDLIDKLFQVFTQADSSTTRKYGGTGLGLVISKRIIELMGGKIWVESEEEKGSRFIFTAAFEKMDQPENSTSNCNHINGLEILIVDYNGTSRRILREYLSGLCNITDADKSEDAIRLLDSGRHFDLVIIDYKTAVADGTALTSKIKGPGMEDTKLLLLTSTGKKGGGRMLSESSFSGYITKPIRKRELIQCINTVFGCEEYDSTVKSIAAHHVFREDEYFRRHLILLVEDNPANQRLMTVILRRLGLGFEVACNGQEAVEAADKKEYLLILMDCQMPVMDGYEASRQIKNNSAMNRNTPIIAMTANALEGDREKCLMEGMDDYISKPVSSKRIKETFDKWI